MPEKWTGRLIGKMHNAGITRVELAEEMGVRKAYISMILNGQRNPQGARERLETAFERVKEKKEGRHGEGA